MLPDMKIPKDIKEYEPKILFNLTWKQLLFTVAGLVAIFFTTKALEGLFSPEMLKYVPWIVGTPFALLGFFKINGMSFDKFIKVTFVDNYMSPKKRIYKIENTFIDTMNEVSKEEEDYNKKNKIKDKSAKEKKRRYKKSKSAIK